MCHLCHCTRHELGRAEPGNVHFKIDQGRLLEKYLISLILASPMSPGNSNMLLLPKELPVVLFKGCLPTDMARML